jgi:hypothetical protein
MCRLESCRCEITAHSSIHMYNIYVYDDAGRSCRTKVAMQTGLSRTNMYSHEGEILVLQCVLGESETLHMLTRAHTNKHAPRAHTHIKHTHTNTHTFSLSHTHKHIHTLHAPMQTPGSVPSVQHTSNHVYFVNR